MIFIYLLGCRKTHDSGKRLETFFELGSDCKYYSLHWLKFRNAAKFSIWEPCSDAKDDVFPVLPYLPACSLIVDVDAYHCFYQQNQNKIRSTYRPTTHKKRMCLVLIQVYLFVYVD